MTFDRIRAFFGPTYPARSRYEHTIKPSRRRVLRKDIDVNDIWEEWYDDVYPDYRNMDTPLVIPSSQLPGGPVIKRVDDRWIITEQA